MRHPIFLFRHGETVWNAEKRAQGYLDSPLTAAGRAQARAMGETLARQLQLGGYPPSGVIVRASAMPASANWRPAVISRLEYEERRVS